MADYIQSSSSIHNRTKKELKREKNYIIITNAYCTRKENEGQYDLYLDGRLHKKNI